MRAGKIILASLILNATASLLAGGFTVPLIGARMMGRAHFGPVADDTTAIYHNPAGLTKIEGYRFDVSATHIFSHTEYRVAHEDGTFSDAITFEKPQGTLPFVGFAGDFGSERWRFGLAVYAPHVTTASLPPESEAKFQLIDGNIFTLFVTPTVAYKVSDKLSVGFGASLVSGHAELKRWTDLSGSVGLPLTAIVDLSADDKSFGWDCGALYEPTDRLSLSLTYQSQTDLTFTGGLTATNDAIDLVAMGDVSADFTLPQTLRLGFDYAITPKLTAGIEGYWMDYSVYQKLEVKVSHLNAHIGAADLTLADTSIVEVKNSADIYALGAGGAYRFTDSWELASGVFYDQSPYPDNTYTILSPDADKFGISAGATFRHRGLEVSAAYMRLIYQDRDVHRSILSPPANGNVHGKFANAFALELGYAF